MYYAFNDTVDMIDSLKRYLFQTITKLSALQFQFDSVNIIKSKMTTFVTHTLAQKKISLSRVTTSITERVISGDRDHHLDLKKRKKESQISNIT